MNILRSSKYGNGWILWAATKKIQEVQGKTNATEVQPFTPRKRKWCSPLEKKERQFFWLEKKETTLFCYWTEDAQNSPLFSSLWLNHPFVKYARQIGSFSQVGVKKNIWNHRLEIMFYDFQLANISTLQAAVVKKPFYHLRCADRKHPG